MRRFTHTTWWTWEKCIDLNNILAYTAKSAVLGKGLFVFPNAKKIYFDENKKSSDFWKTLVGNGLQWSGLHSNKNQRAIISKADDYKKMQENLWNYLDNDDLGMEMILKPKDVEESKDKMEDFSERMQVLAYHPFPDVSDTPEISAMKQRAKTLNINFHEALSFFNLMDLNMATVRMIDHCETVQANLNTAMELIERSFGQSKQNSNISGMLYTEIRNLSQMLKNLPNQKGDDIMRERYKIAISLDKMDTLADKYLDYKVDNYKASAHDKIKAAVLVKNIVNYCYFEKGCERKIASVEHLDMAKWNDWQKRKKLGRNSIAEKINRKGWKIVKNEFEKMEDDIMNMSVTKMSDHTLENAIQAKQQEQAAGPQL